MKSTIKFVISLTALMLMAGIAYASVQSWRHVMPKFVVKVRTIDSGNKAPTLILIYAENGSDPFLGGPLGSGRRISACETIGSLCVSRAARKEFGTFDNRPQSLQIRLLNGTGNPIVGGVRWTGVWHPEQVRVTCDLRVADLRRSCAVLGVTS